MVSIEKKVFGKHDYYYLEQSIRKGRKVEKKTLYIGKKIPTNIDKIKRNFLEEIYKVQYFNVIETIRQKYLEEQRQTSLSSKEKSTTNFTTRFTYDSQRIEGSTLTLRETAILLEKGISPNNRPIEDIKEAEAHKMIFYEILKYRKDFSLAIILEWHKSLFQHTKADIAGKIRKHGVRISGSKFIPPLAVEVYPMLRDFFRWYAREKDKMNPVQLAALVHLKFVTIHPFSDGNGRISRLLMNFILNKVEYPLFNIPYEGRNSYYRALERAQIKGEDDFFLQWFMKKYIKEYKNYH
jgi:cell filamentation protein, protein adenylyltransferase